MMSADHLMPDTWVNSPRLATNVNNYRQHLAVVFVGIFRKYCSAHFCAKLSLTLNSVFLVPQNLPLVNWLVKLRWTKSGQPRPTRRPTPTPSLRTTRTSASSSARTASSSARARPTSTRCWRAAGISKSGTARPCGSTDCRQSEEQRDENAGGANLLRWVIPTKSSKGLEFFLKEDLNVLGEGLL